MSVPILFFLTRYKNGKYNSLTEILKMLGIIYTKDLDKISVLREYSKDNMFR